jgi:O-antigen/teichoic acid export membrane protein
MSDKSITGREVVGYLNWKILERFLTQGVGLIVQIILARILLPHDFGSMAIMLSIINYLGIFIQSGLAITIVQRKNLENKDISSLFSISLLIATVLYFILFFSAPWIGYIYKIDITLPIRILSLSFFLSSINSIQVGILTRHLYFKMIFIRSVLSITVAGVTAILMAINGFGIWALVAYSLVSSLFAIIAMSFVPEARIRLGISWKRVKELYAFSIKIVITNLICGAGDTFRTMLIGKKYTTPQLAYYDKAYTYSNTITQIITSSISGVLLPTFSRQQDDISRLRSMARKSMQITAYITFPLLFGVLIMSKSLVLLLLTDKWAPCIPFLMIFCILRLCGPITTIDKQVYYSLGRSELGLYFETGLLVANLLMLLSIIKYGILAIAIGATLIEFLGSIALFVVSQHVYGYRIKDRVVDLIKPILNSLVMIIAMYPLSLFNLSNLLTIIAQSTTGILIYYILSRLTKDNSLLYIKELFMVIIKK